MHSPRCPTPCTEDTAGLLGELVEEGASLCRVPGMLGSIQLSDGKPHAVGMSPGAATYKMGTREYFIGRVRRT